MWRVCILAIVTWFVRLRVSGLQAAVRGSVEEISGSRRGGGWYCEDCTPGARKIYVLAVERGLERADQRPNKQRRKNGRLHAMGCSRTVETGKGTYPVSLPVTSQLEQC